MNLSDGNFILNGHIQTQAIIMQRGPSGYRLGPAEGSVRRTLGAEPGSGSLPPRVPGTGLGCPMFAASAARAAAGDVDVDVDVDVDAVACPSPSILSSCVILLEANFFFSFNYYGEKRKEKML